MVRYYRRITLGRPGRTQVGDEIGIEHESPYGCSFVAFEADSKGDVVVGAEQANVDAVELVVKTNVGDRREIDDAVTNTDKLGIHRRAFRFSLSPRRRWLR